jgi:hypothetical protein
MGGPGMQWFRLALGLAPILCLNLVDWRRIETRYGVTSSGWLRALVMLTVDVWVTWPLAYLDYARALLGR